MSTALTEKKKPVFILSFFLHTTLASVLFIGVVYVVNAGTLIRIPTSGGQDDLCLLPAYEKCIFVFSPGRNQKQSNILHWLNSIDGVNIDTSMKMSLHPAFLAVSSLERASNKTSMGNLQYLHRHAKEAKRLYIDFVTRLNKKPAWFNIIPPQEIARCLAQIVFQELFGRPYARSQSLTTVGYAVNVSALPFLSPPEEDYVSFDKFLAFHNNCCLRPKFVFISDTGVGSLMYNRMAHRLSRKHANTIFVRANVLYDDEKMKITNFLQL